MEPTEFGTYLKRLRNSRKLTVRQLDELSGVSHSYISQIEIGTREPKYDIIRKLSTALGVTHIGMMIKAGHVTEEEVLTMRRESGVDGSKDVRDTFGDFFRKVRRSQGFKEQKQLAEASGISQSTISRIEEGIQQPSVSTLITLADSMNYPIDKFLEALDQKGAKNQ